MKIHDRRIKISNARIQPALPQLVLVVDTVIMLNNEEKWDQQCVKTDLLAIFIWLVSFPMAPPAKELEINVVSHRQHLKIIRQDGDKR